jgi:signal transduction histidine kinase
VQFKLKTKLQFYFCLVGIFSVTLTGVILYNNAKHTLENISFERLTSIREIKKKFVLNYFDQISNLTLTLADNETVISKIRKYRNGDITGGIPDKNDLGLRDIAVKFNVDDILLISAIDRKIVFSLKRPNDAGKKLNDTGFTAPDINSSFSYPRNNRNKEIYITDYTPHAYNSNKPAAFISAPVYYNGKKEGIIAIELSVDQLNQIMTNNNSWREIGFGETAETYIVGSDFRMRTDSRFFIQEPEKYFAMLKKTGVQNELIQKIKSNSTSILLQEVKTTASTEGAKGESNTKIINDYRGVEVISAYSPLTIANLNWIIISEIDTREAFGDIISLREYLILAGILVILLASSLGIIFSKSISKPIGALTKTAEFFGKGNLEYRTDIKNDDEFGLLFSTFNIMADKIMRNTTELKMEIEDRREISEQLMHSREQLRNLSSHLQSVREEERKLIAREIHDELGQALNTLKLQLSLIKQSGEKDKKDTAVTLNDLLALIDNTINSVRRIITELRPQLLDDLGLTAAIEWQVNEFTRNSGIDCQLRITPEEIKTDSDKAIAFFRILQEALTNIARHSQATCVDITLLGKQNSIEMTITDNGIGIKEDDLTNSKSFGLLGIKERAHYLGGIVIVQSVPMQGTSVIVSIPNITGEI